MRFELHEVAREIAACYAALPQTQAAALGGSTATGRPDEFCDLDLYIYISEELPLKDRRQVAERHGERIELDNRFWEPSDEWIERDSGVKVDVVYRNTVWIEHELDRLLYRHKASLGYTTCLWHNVRASHALFDRDGWYAQLQELAALPYPEELRRAIVSKNHPVLRRSGGSYLKQLRIAVERGDVVSVNHRIAALLASYFDILFAVNRQAHPGEKRLLQAAVQHCEKRPPGLEEDVRSLISTATGDPGVIPVAEALIDGLDRLLVQERLLSP